eukprot:15456404-Alexandrium_andersonii.AAC.1
MPLHPSDACALAARSAEVLALGPSGERHQRSRAPEGTQLLPVCCQPSWNRPQEGHTQKGRTETHFASTPPLRHQPDHMRRLGCLGVVCVYAFRLYLPLACQDLLGFDDLDISESAPDTAPESSPGDLLWCN